MIATVRREWPGATVVLLGGGPSLTAADVGRVRGCGRVIAVNDGYRLAAWADALYGCDAEWWGWHRGVPTFAGLKYALEPQPTVWPDVQVLRNTGPTGLETDPTALRTGRNSGYQALNLAVHLGAARVLLLGFDLSPDRNGREHWFGRHPAERAPSPYADMRACFDTLVEPLAAAGVTVWNCSRRTALAAFPCVALEDALGMVPA
jgi:hypothetical protein